MTLLNEQGHIDPPSVAQAARKYLRAFLERAGRDGPVIIDDLLDQAIICAVCDACSELSARKIAELRSEVMA